MKAKDLIEAALTDPVQAKALLANPAQYFRQGGIDIPADHSDQFNSFFSSKGGALVEHLSSRGKTGQTEVGGALEGLGCLSCEIEYFQISLTIIALGVAGLSTVGPESIVVTGLATATGASTTAVIAFLGTLGALLSQGPQAVTRAICKFAGACSG